ncbi:MAG: contractile injection system protein, VgrG/Pvc8 family [Acetatifactor muris]|nr:contractile injection system protein, VgrG/Pvc8 family [Acetatifactor muris]
MGKNSGKALADKYGDFLYPEAKVFAAGRKVPESDARRLESVEVNASVGKEPDMAVLVYRVDKLPAKNQTALEGYLEVGQRMEVRAGYDGQDGRIFLGYLHQVEVCDLMQGFLEYTLICLDVKGLMKKNSVFRVSGAGKLQQIRDDILEESGYQFLMEKKSVSPLPENLNQACVVRGETHYDWLCNLAEYVNYEFFCGMGEVVFRKAGEGNGESVELSPEYGLQAVQRVVSMTGQTGSVSVWGYNRKDEKLTGTAQWRGEGGVFAGKLGQALKSFSLKLWDMELETGEQASALAQAVMSRSKAACCRLEAVTIGFPELQPGCNAEIVNEKAACLSGTVYVEEVCHRLDWQGYRTVIRGRCDEND